jgi:hypothetical protein
MELDRTQLLPRSWDAQSRLERDQRYATKYEIVAVLNGTTRLVLYTGQHSRSGLIASVRQRGEELVKFCKAEEFDLGKRAADGVHIGNWHIAFSGRTKREAISEGEFPFIA